jgi:uncharacterized protein
MIVGLLELDLRLPGVNSLKDKRHVLRGLIERLRRDFHVAISEVGDHDLWGNAVLGVAVVSNDPQHAERILAKVKERLESQPEIEVVGSWQEIERR